MTRRRATCSCAAMVSVMSNEKRQQVLALGRLSQLGVSGPPVVRASWSNRHEQSQRAHGHAAVRAKRIDLIVSRSTSTVARVNRNESSAPARPVPRPQHLPERLEELLVDAERLHRREPDSVTKARAAGKSLRVVEPEQKASKSFSAGALARTRASLLPLGPRVALREVGSDAATRQHSRS